MYLKINYHIACILIALILMLKLGVSAEQTIINVPSSEILPLGEMLIKESNKFSPFVDRGYTSITPSFTFGAGHQTQFSVGAGTTLSDFNTVKGNFAAKKVFFLGNSTRLTVGGAINPYFNAGATPDSLVYTHLSQRIKKTKTSLTAGIYAHGQKHLPNNAGVLLGMEQVIIPNKLRFALDWISGDNSYGKMGIGLKYKPVPSMSITSAVIVPGNDDENIAFNVSISKYLSIKDFSKKKGDLEL